MSKRNEIKLVLKQIQVSPLATNYQFLFDEALFLRNLGFSLDEILIKLEDILNSRASLAVMMADEHLRVLKRIQSKPGLALLIQKELSKIATKRKSK